jgi:Peptidase family M20/M25/M40
VRLIRIMRTLKERRVVTRHPLRMAIWTNEEDGFTDSVSRPANCSRATWPASIAGSPWQTAFANSAAIQPGWTRPGFLQEKIEAAAAELGLKTMRLPSGGGHDVQMIAKVAPICMIFSPQRRWHQHSPKGVHALGGLRQRLVANDSDDRSLYIAVLRARRRH